MDGAAAGSAIDAAAAARLEFEREKAAKKARKAAKKGKKADKHADNASAASSSASSAATSSSLSVKRVRPDRVSVSDLGSESSARSGGSSHRSSSSSSRRRGEKASPSGSRRSGRNGGGGEEGPGSAARRSTAGGVLDVPRSSSTDVSSSLASTDAVRWHGLKKGGGSRGGGGADYDDDGSESSSPSSAASSARKSRRSSRSKKSSSAAAARYNSEHRTERLRAGVDDCDDDSDGSAYDEEEADLSPTARAKRKVMRLLAKKDLEEAALQLSDLLLKDPSDPDLYVMRARVAYASKELSQAASWLRQGARYDPLHPGIISLQFSVARRLAAAAPASAAGAGAAAEAKGSSSSSSSSSGRKGDTAAAEAVGAEPAYFGGRSLEAMVEDQRADYPNAAIPALLCQLVVKMEELGLRQAGGGARKALLGDPSSISSSSGGSGGGGEPSDGASTTSSASSAPLQRSAGSGGVAMSSSGQSALAALAASARDLDERVANHLRALGSTGPSVALEPGAAAGSSSPEEGTPAAGGELSLGDTWAIFRHVLARLGEAVIPERYYQRLTHRPRDHSFLEGLPHAHREALVAIVTLARSLLRPQAVADAVGIEVPELALAFAPCILRAPYTRERNVAGEIIFLSRLICDNPAQAKWRPATRGRAARPFDFAAALVSDGPTVDARSSISTQSPLEDQADLGSTGRADDEQVMSYLDRLGLDPALMDDDDLGSVSSAQSAPSMSVSAGLPHAQDHDGSSPRSDTPPARRRPREPTGASMIEKAASGATRSRDANQVLATVISEAQRSLRSAERLSSIAGGDPEGMDHAAVATVLERGVTAIQTATAATAGEGQSTSSAAERLVSDVAAVASRTLRSAAALIDPENPEDTDDVSRAALLQRALKDMLSRAKQGGEW